MPGTFGFDFRRFSHYANRSIKSYENLFKKHYALDINFPAFNLTPSTSEVDIKAYF